MNRARTYSAHPRTTRPVLLVLGICAHPWCIASAPPSTDLSEDSPRLCYSFICPGDSNTDAEDPNSAPDSYGSIQITGEESPRRGYQLAYPVDPKELAARLLKEQWYQHDSERVQVFQDCIDRGDLERLEDLKKEAENGNEVEFYYYFNKALSRNTDPDLSKIEELLDLTDMDQQFGHKSTLVYRALNPRITSVLLQKGANLQAGWGPVQLALGGNIVSILLIIRALTTKIAPETLMEKIIEKFENPWLRDTLLEEFVRTNYPLNTEHPLENLYGNLNLVRRLIASLNDPSLRKMIWRMVLKREELFPYTNLIQWYSPPKTCTLEEEKSHHQTSQKTADGPTLIPIIPSGVHPRLVRPSTVICTQEHHHTRDPLEIFKKGAGVNGHMLVTFDAIKESCKM